MSENWKWVVGYEGIYSVSDLGRIRSEERTMRHSWKEGALVKVREKIRVQTPYGKSGYLGFVACKEGEQQTLRTHICILQAFVSSRPSGQQARHLNGRHHDNRLENLAWGTKAQNDEDKRRHGNTARGVRISRAKLTDDIVRTIRTSGISSTVLAIRYGVDRSTVKAVRRGQTWKHVI